MAWNQIYNMLRTRNGNAILTPCFYPFFFSFGHKGCQFSVALFCFYRNNAAITKLLQSLTKIKSMFVFTFHWHTQKMRKYFTRQYRLYSVLSRPENILQLMLYNSHCVNIKIQPAFHATQEFKSCLDLQLVLIFIFYNLHTNIPSEIIAYLSKLRFP